jgi:hypothetical protein
MTAAAVTVLVREDTPLGPGRHVLGSGEVHGCLSLGDGDVCLCGPAVALSRLAVGLLGAANAAERLVADRAAAAEPGAA